MGSAKVLKPPDESVRRLVCRLSQIDETTLGAFSTTKGRLLRKTLRVISSLVMRAFFPATKIPAPALSRNFELSIRTLEISCDSLFGSKSIPALGRVPRVFLNTDFSTSKSRTRIIIAELRHEIRRRAFERIR